MTPLTARNENPEFKYPSAPWQRAQQSRTPLPHSSADSDLPPNGEKHTPAPGWAASVPKLCSCRIRNDPLCFPTCFLGIGVSMDHTTHSVRLPKPPHVVFHLAPRCVTPRCSQSSPSSCKSSGMCPACHLPPKTAMCTWIPLLYPPWAPQPRERDFKRYKRQEV